MLNSTAKSATVQGHGKAAQSVAGMILKNMKHHYNACAVWKKKESLDNHQPERHNMSKANEAAEQTQTLRQDMINSMTNWQRNQAGRACKGVWSKLTVPNLEKFANMQRT